MAWFYQPEPRQIDANILASISYEEEVPPRGYTKYNKQTNFSAKKPNDYTLKKKKTYHKKSKVRTIPNAEPISFAFNPNTISKDSLKLLGLSRYTINSLLKYRSKGGKIKSKDQFIRFNGLDESTINRLTSFIDLPTKAVISDKAKLALSSSKRDTSSKGIKRIKYKKKQPRIIEINSADTTDFMNLYGIGKVYSKRIIAYRNSIGGFFDINQIKEVWGITDSLYLTLVPYLQVNPDNIRKQNLNELTKKELGRHNYVGWHKSKMIMAYKGSHGAYKSMEDLYKLHALTKADVDTLKLYFDIK